MKVWKIVSGVLSIALSLFVVFQSLFAGAYNILTGNGQSSGTAGIVVAIMLLTGGILSIATHNGSRGGDIAMSILFGIGGVIGLVAAGSYSDLRVWAVWCLLCGVLAMVDIALDGRSKREDISIPVQARAWEGQNAPTTFQGMLTELDPARRNAAIDALPERQAKGYLKQAMGVLAPWTAAKSEGDDNALVKILVAILAVLGVGIIAIIAVGVSSSSGKDQETAQTPPTVASNAVQQSASPEWTPSPSDVVSQTVDQGASSGTLGDFYVEVKEAYITEDYEGNPAIAITYAWTNNSSETTYAAIEISERAFQNGVEMDAASMSMSNQNYDTRADSREIRPGTTIDVQCAFKLTDRASPIEIELYEAFSLSDAIVSAVFDPETLRVEE